MADNIETVAEWLYNYAVKLSGRPDWYDSWAECREEIKEDFRRDARQIDALYQEGSPMYLDKDGQWKMKAQPDDLLLSDEEIHKLAEEVIQDNAIEAFEFAKKLAKAQHAKDQKRIDELTRKGEALCQQNGELLIQIHDCQKRIEQVFEDLEDMKLIKEHHGHKQGEVKLVACARCTYEDYKTRTLAKIKEE